MHHKETSKQNDQNNYITTIHLVCFPFAETRSVDVTSVDQENSASHSHGVQSKRPQTKTSPGV